MKHTGGCQCGAVRFETTGEPVRAMGCHCTTCKLRTGAGYGIGVYFKEENVKFLQGEMQQYQFESDTSGRWLLNEFCKQCGSAVTWTTQMRPGLRAIAGGCYDDPNWYALEGHIWARSARSDMCYAEGMPVYEEALPQ